MQKYPLGGEGERYSLNFKKLLQFLINYYKSKNILNCAALSKLVQTLTKYFEIVPNSVKNPNHSVIKVNLYTSMETIEYQNQKI